MINDEKIVIDNGSGTIKAGFAGDQTPRAYFSSIIGVPKVKKEKNYLEKSYIGKEAQEKRGILNLKYPIEHGKVMDWDEMEAIWHHTLNNELRVEPDHHPNLLTDACLNATDNREKMTEIFFEKFKCPAFYVVIQPVLSLYSTGKITGIVAESGDGITQTVPVFEGYVMPHTFERRNFGGRELTDYLIKLLYNRGHHFTTTAEKEIVRDIKEKLCCVSIDAYNENTIESQKLEKSYLLPDGQVVYIGSERFMCTEAIFSPDLIGLEMPGIHELIFESLKRVNKSLTKDLLSCVVLAGGNTMYPGIKERMVNELSKLNPDKMNMNVLAPSKRKYSAWKGGSVLASMSTFNSMWITKKEYSEFGMSILKRKCF